MIMRNSFYSLFAVIVSAALFAFTSCTGEIDSERQSDLSDETVSVTLSALSFEFDESPITKSVPTYGLYGVQVTDRTTGELYACWLTDDLSRESFKFNKGTKYGILVVFVPNGQNVLEGKDGLFGPPFMNEYGPDYLSPVLGDDIYYGGDMNIKSFAYGAQKKGYSSWSSQSNLLNDVDIYCGGAEITPESDVSLEIHLFRCMFGLHIEVSNLNEGKVHIYENSFTNYTYADLLRNNGICHTLTPEKSSMDKILELVYIPGFWNDVNYINYKSSLNINIDYEYPDGRVVTLFKKSNYVKRMYRYSFSFNLEEVLNSVTGGVNASVEDEEWKDLDLDDPSTSSFW